MPFADSTWSATVSTTISKQSSMNIDVKRRPTDVIPVLSTPATVYPRLKTNRCGRITTYAMRLMMIDENSWYLLLVCGVEGKGAAMWAGSDGVSVSVVVRLDSPSRFSLETYMAIAVLADHILCWSLSSSSVGFGRACSHLKKLSRETIVERMTTSSRPVRTIASITVVGSLITPAEKIQVYDRGCQVYIRLLIQPHVPLAST